MMQHLAKDLYSTRLELKHLEPNMRNAEMIFNVLRNENPDDYKYEPLMMPHALPSSVNETLEMMVHYAEFEADNGCVFYMFHAGQFIGVRKLYFYAPASTLKFSTVWLVSGARHRGFAQESFRVIEEIAFNKMKVNRLSRVNIADNADSAALARVTGFVLDGISRQAVVLPDGKFYDLMMWSKLYSDYQNEKNAPHVK